MMVPTRVRPVRCVLLTGALALLVTTADAQESLPTRIDRLMEAGQTGPASPASTDAEFLRRLSLDLLGTIPTAAEFRGFLQDSSPNKREAVIDRYLADPRFELYWAEVFDVMLMERRADKHVPHAEWLKYLQTSFHQNKPWDQLAREILSADGTDPALRPAAKFWLDRDAEPHLLTRDVGRIFFGIDLQCAQCHDHPLVEHYLQSDYYGLFAFNNRTVLFNDEAAKKMLLGEKAEGDAAYKSVFTGDASQSRPRLPGGSEMDEPHFRLGEEYQVAPAAKVRPIPKFSRRALLAQHATTGQNVAFNRNIANRIWGTLLGRGLVHPVDMHHPHNPASHPEVLELVTQEFVTAKFNIRWLVRQLVLTQAYQRSFDLPADPTLKLATAAEQLPVVDAQLTSLAVTAEEAKKAVAAAYEASKAAQKAIEDKDKAFRDALQAAITARKPVTDAEAALAKTQGQLVAKKTAINALVEASTKTADAVKAIPNDAELTQAAAVFEKRVKQAQDEHAALEKTATDQATAITAAKEKWTPTIDASETAYTAFVEAAKPWEAEKAKWLTTRAAALAAETVKQQTAARHKSWQQSVEFSQKRQLVTQAEQAVPAAQAQLTAAQQAVAQQQTDIAAKQSALNDAQKAFTTAAQALDAAKADLAAKQALAQTVGEAAAKTAAAVALLPNDAELAAALATLKARQEPLASATKSAESVATTRATEHQAAATQMQAAQQQLQAADAELSNRQKAMDAAALAATQAQGAVIGARAAVETALGVLSDTWTNQALSRTVKPMTPEQLAWSWMESCGVVEQYRLQADAEIEKTIPKASVETDAAKKIDRDFQAAQLTREKLRGVTQTFIGLYASAGGQPQDVFFATADQALFVANGGSVRSWGNNLANRLNGISDAAALADELYSCALSRKPSEAEAAQVSGYLAGRPNDRPVALQEIVWALLASAEFRFNH